MRVVLILRETGSESPCRWITPVGKYTFTVGRKNWLFADTPKGAYASAAVYSIIETAKANGLNVYTYLEYLLLYMPDTDWRNCPEELDMLMPWSESVQAECK